MERNKLEYTYDEMMAVLREVNAILVSLHQIKQMKIKGKKERICGIIKKYRKGGKRMTREEKRKLKRELKREISKFLKIQNHYFPYLIQEIKKILDSRNESYITYEIEVIIYVMILKIYVQ